MTNQQEKLARQWAERIKSVPREYHDEMHHAVADFILAHTAPSTMADVVWDDEKHYLAGATTPRGDVVMMWPDDDAGDIVTDKGAWQHAALTPNGKRYELREVTVSSGENVGADQPDHPEVLTTVEDYESAPLGTVVASPRFRTWTKNRSDEWICGMALWKTSEMAGITHTVLRWGDGA